MSNPLDFYQELLATEARGNWDWDLPSALRAYGQALPYLYDNYPVRYV